MGHIRAWKPGRTLHQRRSTICYPYYLTPGYFGPTTTSSRGIIFRPTWGAAVSCCTVWLKTLNLTLMGGNPQYIYLFFVVLVFTFIFIFILFSRITFVFSFQRQKGYFSSSLGMCYKPCQSNSSLTPNPGQLFP
jgi:hypothetical protein